MSYKKQTITKDNLDLLFSDNYSFLIKESSLVKVSQEQDTGSIGTINKAALNSIQSLFDDEYKKGGYESANNYGKALYKSFSNEKISSIINAEHEKQITGEMMAKVMESESAMNFLKTVKIPHDTEKETKTAVVSVWKEAWESIKRNVSMLSSLGGAAFDAVYKSFTESTSWYIGVGAAMFALWKFFGSQLSKIFKFLKFIPGLSIVLDISLAIKNIYYIQKEILDGDWNETMESINQTSFVIEEPKETPKISYPNSLTRIMSNMAEALTEKIKFAFYMGAVALKCLVAGFKVPEIFNKILEQDEANFLSGNMSAQDFALSVGNHIKASRKIKLVCSEMIGLLCNTSSALFDVAGAAIGIGTVVSIIGNLVIAGIDMSIREAIILSCKNFEDFWSKKIMDYRQLFMVYISFSNDSDRRLSGDDSNNNFNKNQKLLEVKDQLVDENSIKENNQKAFDETRDEFHKKKAA